MGDEVMTEATQRENRAKHLYFLVQWHELLMHYGTFETVYLLYKYTQREPFKNLHKKNRLC